jgi:hypothetical protein
VTGTVDGVTEQATETVAGIRQDGQAETENTGTTVGDAANKIRGE